MKTIELTQDRVTQVDDSDYEWLSKFKWSAAKRVIGKAVRWEARAKVNGKDISMHRLILNAQRGEWVDHKDHDGLNNQRNNLRICDPLGNAQNAKIRQDNTSGFKGLGWQKKLGKWQVTIQYKHKNYYFGVFSDKFEAARVYDYHAQKLFGEFACTNESLGLL